MGEANKRRQKDEHPHPHPHPSIHYLLSCAVLRCAALRCVGFKFETTSDSPSSNLCLGTRVL
ncbi:hypothetical protein AMTR_s00197p00038180 [Amborella trichopoda]|uniref:Uncharacterized protein n=1 Tax=Amborella trichopoda TaxID=13333 RepID=U5DDJ6_AMBTC|nr:hypothetical protein AMTR_s00197p00038180 [Amborella trichopoda]